VFALDNIVKISRSKGIGVLDYETVLVKLDGIRGCQARKLLTCGIDDVEITIGAVIPAQTSVGVEKGALRKSSLRCKSAAAMGVLVVEVTKSSPTLVFALG
jgi:hypothetical protein